MLVKTLVSGTIRESLQGGGGGGGCGGGGGGGGGGCGGGGGGVGGGGLRHATYISIFISQFIISYVATNVVKHFSSPCKHASGFFSVWAKA